VAEAIGIIGQAVLVVMGLVLLAVLVLFLLWSIRAAVKLSRDIWPPKTNQPYTDAYLPEMIEPPS
jgi:hypothetical protein